MHDTVLIRMPTGARALLRKYGPMITLLAGWCMAIGIARGKYSSFGDRLDAVEQTHPDATALLARDNQAELAAQRLQIDRISHDVADVRVDLAKLCTAFGLQPVRGVDVSGGVDIGPRAKNAAGSP